MEGENTHIFRVHQFYEPGVSDYLTLFQDGGIKRGGSLDEITYYKTPRRGGSLFNFLKQTVFPLIKPILFGYTSKVLSDVNEGKHWKTSMKSRALEEVQNVLKNTRGGRRRRRVNRKKKSGLKGKKKKKKKSRPRKRSKLDVFAV